MASRIRILLDAFRATAFWHVRYDVIVSIVKIRKSITLSEKAIVVGEKLAALHGISFSALVEKQILASAAELTSEHYWSEAGRPVPRRGGARYENLRKKHK